MIRAILWAHFLSMRVGGRRGGIAGLLVSVVWYGLWTGLAAAVYAMASSAEGNSLPAGVAAGFLLVLAYWQVVPVFSASMGSGLDLRKLLVYPFPHRRLFAVEALLRLAAGGEMVLILLGGAAGLLRNHVAGGWAAVPRVTAAVLLFMALNVLLASGMRSLLERLLGRRYVREAVVLLLLLAWSVPRVLWVRGSTPQWLTNWGAALTGVVWPWAAAARAAFGDAGAMWRGLAILVCWTGLAWWFGRAQFERGLRFDSAAADSSPAAAPPTPGWAERFYRLPGVLWRDPVAAIVEKELRSMARTPRFRVVFIMGFTFGLLVWFPVHAGRRGVPAGAAPGWFLAVVAVYALTLLGQVTYWNAFGFDRSAAQLWFLAPQPFSAALKGKNIACLIVIFIETLIVTGVTAAVGMAAGWANVLETLVVVGVCSLYMLALGNVSSVHYPRPLSPERVSQGGASSRFQALTFLFYPVALVPVGLAYLARYAFSSQAAFLIMLALAAAIGLLVYRLALDSAVSTAVWRRERLIAELSRGEGPVASN